MRRYCTLLWKTLAVPLGMVGVVLLAILIWSFGNYGGVRYGFDRLSGYTIVPVQSVVDLGEVEAGQTVIAQFRLKNLSKNNVTILGTESDCSCTAFDALPLKMLVNHQRVNVPTDAVLVQTAADQSDIFIT